MGLFGRIKRFILGEPADDGGSPPQVHEEEDMPYYSEENEPTVIYSEDPELGGVSVKTQSGGYGGNASSLNKAMLQDVARTNAQITIPGQVNTARPRQAPRGRAPRRLAPPQQPQQPQQAPQYAPQYAQPYQQQFVQQPQYVPPQPPPPPPQPAYDMQYAQQAYMQQQNAYYQQMPQQDEGNIQFVPPQFGEPYYEMIVYNGKYHFFMDLPGVKPGPALQVRYINMNLVITGERQLRANTMNPKGKGKGNKGKKPEFDAMVSIPPFVQKFNYSFNFPRPVDQESFKSELVDGVLHIEMDILGVNGPGGVAISIG